MGAALSLVLSGCVPLGRSAQPEPIDLLCTWTNADTGARLTLTIDGGLTYADVPTSIARSEGSYDPANPGESLSGEGRWQLGDGFYLRDGTGRPQVSMEFPTGENTAEIGLFFVREVGSSWELYALYGDIDRRQPFAFSSSECTPDPLER